jgi:SSS family solute:Na+ symporter
MTLDLSIILLYLIFINIVGIRFSGSKSVSDYFLGGRSIPWLIACFSIVATETSTLTFISIPGLAYISGLGFLQVTFGYLVGRVCVAVFLIPKYFDGHFQTVYEFIQSKFGVASKKWISIIFHITRLLADSVRLFATAIPLSVITGWDYWICILIIGFATYGYTYYGGLRSVVIVDSIQLFLYIVCAVLGMALISQQLTTPFFSVLNRIPEASFKFVSTGLSDGWRSLFGSYNMISGLVGGAFLSFASHGTDHLMVQRVLSCKDSRAAKKAMITSGVIIIFQFALFLVFGLFIKVLLNNMAFDRSDAIIPYFIVNHLPQGIRGLMLAGIFAAAMSTLSSSINSLSASTSVDIMEIDKKDYSDRKKVTISRLISSVWALALIGISLMLQDTKNPLVEVGLSIASVTYGGMMGIFIMGRFFETFHEKAAIAGVVVSILANIYVAFFTGIFWLWYVVIGCFVSFGVACIVNLFKNSNSIT